MLGVISGTAMGMTGLVYYVLVYMLSNLAAFGVIAVVEHRSGKITIDDYNGLILHESTLEFRDDDRLVLAGRNPAICRVLQQVLHICRSAQQ